MLERRFHLEIRTPQRLVYEGDVLSVRAPGALGSFEILAGHIPFLTVLDIGEIRIRESEVPQLLATSGGVFEVLRTGVTVLVESAEWAHEIDVDRAQAARQRALQRLASRDSNIDYVRAQAALTRAVNRLKIVGHP